ncbi:MAG: hypothetical protein WC454_02595 [Phycisphaerae bacterium]|jgi:hypothetical protein
MNKIKRPGLFAVALIVVFALTACVIAGGVEPQKAFLDVNTIIETWHRNYGNIKSMQISYTERVLEKEPSASDPNFLNNLVMLTHVDRVEEGNCFHVRYSTADDGFAKPENIIEEAFDGNTTRYYIGKNKSGIIESGLSARSTARTILREYMLLDIDMLCKKTASGIYWEQQDPNALPRFREIFRWASIKKFTVTVRPELETVAGKLCHVIEITKGDILPDKLWVAHEYGMLPLKYQEYINGRLNGIEVEQVAESNGVWYPVKAYQVKDTERTGRVKEELIVHSFVPNVEVDDNTFRFDFPNGTRVVDKVKGTYYVVGDEGKAEPLKAFLDVNTILETWQRNYGNIKSMQVSYTERVLEAKSPASDPNIYNNLIMWKHLDRVEEGNRYHTLFSYSMEKDGSKPVDSWERTFNGSTTKEYSSKEKQGTIQSGQKGHSVERENLLKEYMLLDTKVRFKKDKSGWEQIDPNALPTFREIFRYASIKKFEVTVHPELETVAGKLCHVIEITKGDRLLDKIWVAHECGMLPMKYQTYVNRQLFDEIEVEQVAESVVSGIWYPIKAYRSSDTERFGKTKYELIVHAFVPNIKVDGNTFRLDFANGTWVDDQVLGVDYVVGNEDKK